MNSLAEIGGPLNWFKSSYSDEGGEACVEVALAWRKSSYSGDEGGECVEAAFCRQNVRCGGDGHDACVGAAGSWRKSHHSGDEGGDCVEVTTALACRSVFVRDSKSKVGPKLEVQSAAWAAFLNFTAGAQASGIRAPRPECSL
ncbi:DUF397 domain-containing protein [Streptomyces sp. I05A-00742]|uniref:DUF397 domain-containing protein n=1 Tax=Streptomyces sp. I05A-00742 TaxID=2732853 RepID=UPI001488D0D1|nr:DUF397 domain-containing protein [Streptomyces sp. I05A-00742]